MKFHLLSAVFFCVFAYASAIAEVPAHVRFSNGDRLSGVIEALSTESLVLKSPLLENPTPFFLRRILDVALTPLEPLDPVSHEASITLTNGDIVRGQLVSIAEDRIELNTWFAGRMKFNRLMVNDIRITEKTQLNYRGPTTLDGWIISGDQPVWSYRDSSLHSNGRGSIARDVDLPDECSVAFTMSWSNALNLRLVLFSKELATDQPPSGYEISLMQRQVLVRNRKTQRIIGSTANAEELQENEKAKIEVQTSLKSGKIALLIDGELIAVWTDPEIVRDGLGRGLHFIAQNDSPMRVSRIEVGSWDGEVTQVPKPQPVNRFMRNHDEFDDLPAPAAKKKLAPGRMELRNGDVIEGDLLSIEGGTVNLKTPFREVRLPVAALRSIALKPVDLERCKRENGDVRAWFPDGSSMVFRLDGVKGELLLGSSQNFQPSEFKLSAFSRIEFNIYAPEFEDTHLANEP